ncbi:MAG: glycosyltransferase family 2 protein [Butyribacter sp.]|nr:glycosyltransferase family 2 protein [bacterium]MDY3853814.1 glycosyltransferase family 2 protein [Butyribacter sp.]
MKKVSIVIGLYNSEKTIGAVLKEIDEAFVESGKYKYEVVLVDDYSPDGVYDVVKKIAQQDKRIKVLHLSKNAGQTNAVIEGYHYADGDYIVEMDDDLQMPAREIIHMLTVLEEGDYDVVFAKYQQQKESAFRRLGSKFNNKMAEWMIGKPKEIRVNSFFIMRKFVKDEFLKYSNHYPYLYGIIFSITKNVANVDVEHRERTNGKSNYTFKKLFGLWLNGFLNFSVQPLRVATKLGFLITFLSFIVIILLIIQRMVAPTQAIGWTSIMISVIFFSGVQLIGIGLLGEYLGRLYLSTSGLPRTTVRETINCEKEEETKEE